MIRAPDRDGSPEDSMRLSREVDKSFFPLLRLNTLLAELGYEETGDFIQYIKRDQRSRPELPVRVTLSRTPSWAIDGTYWLPKAAIPHLLSQLEGAEGTDREIIEKIRNLADWKPS